MLVTSRKTKRWIIPKGWPMTRMAPHAAAAQEALEEAGVVGRVANKPIGSYSYDKRLRTGAVIVCEVHVFPLEVEGQQDDWPEKGKREIRWLSPEEAAAAVEEDVLGNIIRKLRMEE